MSRALTSVTAQQASAQARCSVMTTCRRDGERVTAILGGLLLSQTPELRFCARVLEQAGDTGRHRRLKHPSCLALLVGDEQVFAYVEVRFTLPFTLYLRIGVLSRIQHGLGGGLAEKEAHHGPGPLREIELGGIR